MSENKSFKMNKVAFIIYIILCALTVAGCGFQIFLLIKNGGSAISLLGTIPLILLCGLAMFYAFYGYKLPNNDILKYLFILFGLMYSTKLFESFVSGTTSESVVSGILSTISIILVIAGSCYMAGRLKKIKDCIFMIITVTLFLFAGTLAAAIQYKDQSNFASVFISNLTYVILWLTLATSYVSRFNAFRKIKEKDDKENEENN